MITTTQKFIFGGSAFEGTVLLAKKAFSDDVLFLKNVPVGVGNKKEYKLSVEGKFLHLILFNSSVVAGNILRLIGTDTFENPTTTGGAYIGVTVTAPGLWPIAVLPFAVQLRSPIELAGNVFFFEVYMQNTTADAILFYKWTD